MAAGWPRRGADPATAKRCLKITLNVRNLRQKSHNRCAAARQRHLNAGIPAHFSDNAFNGIVVFKAQYGRRARMLSVRIILRLEEQCRRSSSNWDFWPPPA